jgi:hypothetical protein
MAREPTPVDITDAPDLLRLAEEVRRSGRPRLLRRADEDIAVLSPVPLRAPRGARRYTEADDDAFLASAGGWKDFDLEEFLTHNEESRRVARPPVEL